MTYFGEYFKLLEQVPLEDAARLRQLSYIVRRDARLEPWQRTVLLEQLALLQRSNGSFQSVYPERPHPESSVRERER